MAIFNSYVKLPEGTQYMKIWKSHQYRSSSLENPDFHILLLECLPSNVAIKEKTKLQLPCQFQVVLLGNQGRCSLTARLCQRIHHRIWRFSRDPQVFSEIIQSCGKRLGPNHPNHGKSGGKVLRFLGADSNKQTAKWIPGEMMTGPLHCLTSLPLPEVLWGHTFWVPDSRLCFAAPNPSHIKV